MSYVVKHVPPDRKPNLAIMATMGPAVFRVRRSRRGLEPELNRIGELVRAGMASARINFSWVRREQYPETRLLIKAIRDVERQTGQPIPVVMDLKGPEIRIAAIRADPARALADKSTLVERGDLIWFSQSECAAPPRKVAACVTVTCHFDFVREVRNRLVVGDNDLAFRVRSRRLGNGILAVARHRGTLRRNKGINLPDNPLRNVDPIVPEDLAAINAGFDVDFVAQSFVRSAEDVRRLVRVIDRSPLRGTPVIPKVETPDAVNDIAAILGLDRVFAMMVARGDLGVLMDFRELPEIQRRLIDHANILGKPVIVATQVLEFMMDHPTPSRPEVEGIENALLWGADCLMLSGEVASGDHPVDCVRVASRIVRNTRLDRAAYLAKFNNDFRLKAAPAKPIDFIGHAITEIAREARSPYIVSYASTGVSVSRISRFRPDAPVIAVTVDERQSRRLRLLYNVCPVQVDESLLARGSRPRQPREFIIFVRQLLKDLGLSDRVRGRFLVATLELTKVTDTNSRGIIVFACP